MSAFIKRKEKKKKVICFVVRMCAALVYARKWLMTEEVEGSLGDLFLFFFSWNHARICWFPGLLLVFFFFFFDCPQIYRGGIFGLGVPILSGNCSELLWTSSPLYCELQSWPGSRRVCFLGRMCLRHGLRVSYEPIIN